MRILSWNINRGYQKAGILKLLKRLKADVYLLTEVDRWNKRTGNADVFSYLQKGLGLKGRFAKEFDELDSVWRKIIPIGGGGGGQHGNAIFSKYPIEDYQVINLPCSKKLKWERKTVIPELFEPRKGNRIAQIFKIRQPTGKLVTLANTHLENWRGSWQVRRNQLQTICKHISMNDYNIIVGDCNPVQGITKAFVRRNIVPYEVKELRAYFQSKGLKDPFSDKDYTHPLLAAKLDWIGLSNSFIIKSKQNLKTKYSDHNCLVIDTETSSE